MQVDQRRLVAIEQKRDGVESWTYDCMQSLRCPKQDSAASWAPAFALGRLPSSALPCGAGEKTRRAEVISGRACWQFPHLRSILNLKLRCRYCALWNIARSYIDA